MTPKSTTIRVSIEQRDLLRRLAKQRETTMAQALDDALEALRRDHFYQGMADAEATLRSNPVRWAEYVAERDAWLNADLAGR